MPTAVAQDRFHAIKAGQLWAAGEGADGRLGTNATSDELFGPVQVGTDENWVQVAAGQYFSAAIKADGTLWSCGDPRNGELGQGGADLVTDVLVFTQVGSDSDWAQVACGEYFCVAIKTDGSLWSWGKQDFLGRGESADDPDPGQVGTDSDWAMVSCNQGTLAIKTDGTLWGFGSCSSGEFGVGTAILWYGTPTQLGSDSDWAWVDYGPYNAVAIKTDGTLWGCGANNYSTLTAAFGTNVYTWTQIGSDSDWARAEISAHQESLLAIKTDGSMYACGDNGGGQLGLGNTTTPITSLTQTGSSQTWQAAFSGTDFSVAVTTDGKLFATGISDNGRNGLGYLVDATSWTQIGSDTDWQAVYEMGVGEPPGPDVIAVEPFDLSERFFCTLTGEADETTDVLLPITSLTARRRDGSQSYLSVSIPYTAAIAQEITDRPQGEVVVTRQIGVGASAQVAEIARAESYIIDSTEGANSSSITLTGYQTASNPAPQIVNLIGLQVANSRAGQRRFRCRMNNSLRPGDTAVFTERGDEQYVVGLITVTVNLTQSIMEVTEADG